MLGWSQGTETVFAYLTLFSYSKKVSNSWIIQMLAKINTLDPTVMSSFTACRPRIFSAAAFLLAWVWSPAGIHDCLQGTVTSLVQAVVQADAAEKCRVPSASHAELLCWGCWRWGYSTGPCPSLVSRPPELLLPTPPTCDCGCSHHNAVSNAGLGIQRSLWQYFTSELKAYFLSYFEGWRENVLAGNTLMFLVKCDRAAFIC